MAYFTIMTDSGCDVAAELLKEWDVRCARLTFHKTDGVEDANATDDSKAFYDAMRAGEVFKTSAVNVQGFLELMETELQQGHDILYIGFSSGLSSTSPAAQSAAQELAASYPDRKIIAIDTLCASTGFGMIVMKAKEMREAGADMDTVAAEVQRVMVNQCHWFTVDDLVYLKRGGRISAAAALAGAVLGIKPVMHVDDEGHLVPVTKVRGRKHSIMALAQKYDELAVAPDFCISHGDCIDDALYLEKLIHDKHGVSAKLISDVGPVIGSHSGPGTLALFFEGQHR